MKIIVLLSAFILIGCQPKVSKDLKKAWYEVNSDRDIFQLHTELATEYQAVAQRVEEQDPQEGEVQEAEDLVELQEKLQEEEQRILSVQKQIEKASNEELNYLLSKSN